MSANSNDYESAMGDNNDFDIIIVGAGLAGLACAYNILKRKAGLSVLILEANREIGGRILPKDYSDTFHANFMQIHLTDLLKTLHIDIDQVENLENMERIWYRKGEPSKMLPRFYGAEIHNFLQTTEENALDPRFSCNIDHEDAKELAEMSVNELLRRTVLFGYTRSLCRAFVCSTCVSRNLDDISALWFIVMLNGASGFMNRLKMAIGDSDRYFIQGGISRLAKVLLKNILTENGQIKYVNPVSEIKFNEDRAYVSTGKKHLKCEFVVVAVPPPMLENITIQVPSEYRYNAETSYSSGENIFFNVTYPEWNNIYQGDIVTTWDRNSNLNIAYKATHNDNKLVLAGFLAEFNDSHTQEEDLFSTLNKCYETTEASVYLTYTQRESSNIEVEMKERSPMSTMKPTSIVNNVNQLGDPIGRIFFASSEYAISWPGTMDGAIEAGQITAFSILSRLRPQALTFHELGIMTKYGQRKKGLYSPFKVFAMHYIGLLINIAVFLSFLRKAYPKI